MASLDSSNTIQTYSAAEIDQKLEAVKTEMMEKIDKTIVMTDKNSDPPSSGATSLWLKILS